MSFLGENNLLLQTLFSATASALSDGTKYQNILRVIPADRRQSAVRRIIVQNDKNIKTYSNDSRFDFN